MGEDSEGEGRCTVMWNRCGGAGRGLGSLDEGAGDEGASSISCRERKNVISRGRRG